MHMRTLKKYGNYDCFNRSFVKTSVSELCLYPAVLLYSHGTGMLWVITASQYLSYVS